MKMLRLIVLALLAASVPVRAQERAPENALFSFAPQGAYMLSPFEFGWMPDGESFYFHLRAVEGPVLPVMRYFVQRRELQSIGSSPTQIVLTPQQRTAFSVDFPLAFVSPNGRYAIYGVPDQSCGEAADCSPRLGLADLQTSIHTVILKGSHTDYTVRWSADSRAFLILDESEYGGLGGISYGTVSQIDTPRLRLNMVATYFNGAFGFVDISRDGQRLLLREIADGSETGLIVWDARVPAAHDGFSNYQDGQFILKDEVVAGASFIPGDDRHLWVVLERGIVQYDLETGSIEVINPEINARWVKWAYFSPDTQYVTTSDRFGQVALYSVSLRTADYGAESSA